MNKAVTKLNHTRKLFDLKSLIILDFILCALSFFIVGVIYGQSFDLKVSIPLVLFIAAINIASVWYIIRKINVLT
ncbi:MAG: hypothetical protein ACJAU4_000819 [Glaciecola sp.]|jgi:hypothetical protein